ncbi:hypothetical protein K438DRAFT_1763828 [Mycena galopus ATCC 62051]|nr:hypothetical protein K438DRAFT_1779633 [Mycena galopus ATCC 62051]KAF8189624.1 hypothetical protein K438DRAFT_1763828 [Mycena galopus ATCC 62051]
MLMPLISNSLAASRRNKGGIDSNNGGSSSVSISSVGTKDYGDSGILGSRQSLTDRSEGYWPLVLNNGSSSRGLNLTSKYGFPTNASRLGPLMTVSFLSNYTAGSIYHILADSETVNDLNSRIQSNCSSHLAVGISTNVTPYSAGAAPSAEEVVQFFRNDSVALWLDGYNNTSISSPGNTTAPPRAADAALFICLNTTIGAALLSLNQSADAIDTNVVIVPSL